MQKALSVFGVVLVSACAGTGTIIQAECESKHRDFPEIFQCTYEGVTAKSPEILRDARAKLYLLRGEQLALDVIEKKITSLSAKVAWQQLYVELKSAKEQEALSAMSAVAKSLEASRAAVPPPAQVIAPVRTMVSCTSTKLGTTVYTTCQ